nr:aminotransferase class V-fold PLP-dependent enzyme [Pontixanthobacter luteolus]
MYLDHAATSPIRPEALAAMQDGFRKWANPSSPHAEGRKAKQALEDARARVKNALGWNGEVIFTSGASEALSIGLQRAEADRQIVSAAEHDAVFRAAPGAEVLGLEGPLVDSNALDRLLQADGSAIVAVQHVNSETGVMQPISGLAQQVRSHGGMLLCDCSQSAGKHALPDCDMAVISAHKFGGPIGIGALLVRDYALLDPIGGHERGYRQGTENLPGALGMAAALEQWAPDDPEPFIDVGDKFIELTEIVTDHGGVIVDADGMTTMFIKSIAHPSLSAQAQLIRLDAMGFAVSAGSACSSGTLKKSRVLDAFGVDDETASRTIRVSIGWNTAAEDLERFAQAWVGLT